MSMRTRERFIRTPVNPKPAKVEPTPEPVEKVDVVARPVPQSKGARQWKTRDSCPTCSAKRDRFGRLPIGLCGSGCLMARPR